MDSFDLIVVGAGPGGLAAAVRAARLGMKTALVESRELGGTCLNRGCVPTKALLRSAEILRGARELGLSVPGPEELDFGALRAKKDEAVERLRAGTEALVKSWKISLFRAEARVLGSGRVSAGELLLTGKRILVSPGGRPALPPIPGIKLPGVYTSDGLLESGSPLFQSLVILGGGVVGAEMASLYAALGCRVTLLELTDRLVPSMDRELSQSLAQLLKKQGVQIILSAKVSEIRKSDGGLACVYAAGEREGLAEGSAVLVAAGRRPALDRLFDPGLEIKTEKGYIAVNGDFETSVPGVFAVGDAVGGMQLAHKAEAEGVFSVERMAGLAPEADLSLIPSCVYTEPELASVGLTPDEAKLRGIPVKTGKSLMTSNARNVIEGGQRGFVRLVFHGETEVLLGAQLLCPKASELIGGLTAAAAAKMTRTQLLKGVRPHPSFSEGIFEALAAVDGRSVHTSPGLGR
ncbi:dihydrolipoyl dehydrogenase [Papillibacter cinnamivorans]|uniref:Dihydrolipoyl dehydrogenase n=1 Tax=Papillibacter cinnamivorans DSM 12816 TaxID=1122930 RepID=A0A1W1ZMW1_9FIRM|nr:dihydrolipoyl dehydrogenase [Papillibacter cinnamivorans]SMC49746.1 dihydrolipoamide dehydrogenase [Papillibacter cinnamivorans DSM 12816]